jgi:hypothetical protein
MTTILQDGTKIGWYLAFVTAKLNIFSAIPGNVLFVHYRHMDVDTVTRIISVIVNESFISSVPEMKVSNNNLTGPGIIGAESQEIKFSISSAFLLELLIRLLIHNRDRIMLLWKPVSEHIKLIFMPSSPSNLIGSAATGLIRLMMRLVHETAILLFNYRVKFIQTYFLHCHYFLIWRWIRMLFWLISSCVDF